MVPGSFIVAASDVLEDPVRGTESVPPFLICESADLSLSVTYRSYVGTSLVGRCFIAKSFSSCSFTTLVAFLSLRS